MREMKDSDIDIVGLVPFDWNFKRLKYLCKIETGNQDTQDAEPDGEFPFYVRSPIVERSSRYTFDGEGILMAGDGAGAGRVFHHAFGKYAVHQRVYRLAHFKDISSDYLFYFLRNIFDKQMDKGSAQSTVPSVRLPMLLNFQISIPPLPEQQKIAAYLDKKCSEIDNLTADIQKQIETLEEYKRSVITEAVTKGLDPDVEMRDSGIEWVGEIPSNWKSIQIKHIFTLVSGATPSPDMENWDGEITWITPADYKTKDKYVSVGKRNLSNQGYNSCSTSLIPKGSIVFSKRAPIGTVAMNSEILCTNQGCLSCVSKINTINDFFYYVMSIGTEYFELLGSGTTFKEISANSFANCKLPFPPIIEQKAISDYLDRKCSEIENIISEKKQQIETLEEYKKSLIYEYVTGKKEVI